VQFEPIKSAAIPTDFDQVGISGAGLIHSGMSAAKERKQLFLRLRTHWFGTQAPLQQWDPELPEVVSGGEVCADIKNLIYRDWSALA
jgi:hypothetical protein